MGTYIRRGKKIRAVVRRKGQTHTKTFDKEIPAKTWVEETEARILAGIAVSPTNDLGSARRRVRHLVRQNRRLASRCDYLVNRCNEWKDQLTQTLLKGDDPALSLESLELNEDRQSESSVSTTDAAEHARLAGIYSRQIQARVERVWNRPRTPVSSGSNSSKAPDSVEYFHCEAQIVQDSTGNVQEILLPNCNGSIAWQHSLVVAIQQASQLPAPPSPTVFSHTMTLNFVAYPYVLGASDEGYESPGVETAQISSPTKTP